jgi:hypothetical protein
LTRDPADRARLIPAQPATMMSATCWPGCSPDAARYGPGHYVRQWLRLLRQPDEKAKARKYRSSPLLIYSTPGGLRQGPGRAA